ncbi:MAG: immunoglobulin domain-containing protein [Acidobacteriaceae bacterium]
MTGTWRGFSIGALFAGATLFLIGCANGPTSPPSQAVTITVQPLSQTVPLGQTATFSVTATGTAPLNYLWSENGTNISGATSATYTTPMVELGNNGSTSVGSFQVSVSNSVNSVTSSSVTLNAGPRSPKSGDLRYLLFQQVDLPGLFNTGGLISLISADPDIGATGASGSNAVGGPLELGSSYACGSGECIWGFAFLSLPPPMTGLSMYYQSGEYSNFTSDLQGYAASNVVVTSLDLEPAENAYAVSWVKTSQAGGFDDRIDPLIPPGADQAAQIQAQSALDGTESRVITAVSFDASGNAMLISDGWTGDSTTVYEDQTYLVAPGSGVSANVQAAATMLANNGYAISAFGGNDTDGYILIGMRVKGDTLPRPISPASPNFGNEPPYATPVVDLLEMGVTARIDTLLNEQ